MNAISKFPNKKTALVAGGAGFVGSHLCDQLLETGYRVICVDSFLTSTGANVEPLFNHPDFTLIQADICESLSVNVPLDEVYNLACAASPDRYQEDPLHTMMTNVVGVRNLLELALQHGARFLQASTSEVYGDPETHPQVEDYLGSVSCTGPRACYDEGKRAAESLCFDMMRSHDLDVRVARIFNTYGPRMLRDDGRIVSNLIVQALSDEPLTIYGTGQQTRSFCYVSDLITGLLALMRINPNPRVPVNLGNPGEFTINALADLVQSMIGRPVRIKHLPLPQDDPRRRQPDISRARSLLAWEPVVSLQEGLALTIDHFGMTRDPGRSGILAQSARVEMRLEQ